MTRLNASLLLAALSTGCGADPAPVSEGGSSGDATGQTTGESSSGETPQGESSSGTTPSETGGTSTGEPTEDASSSSTGPGVQQHAIGLVQYDADAHFGDWDYNTAQLTMWAEAAIDEGATLLVFPEGSSYGYATDDDLWCPPGMDTYGGMTCHDVSTVAEPLPGGQTTDYWADFAAEHGVAVVYHVLEADGPDFYNAVGVVGPDGYITKYRKRRLTGSTPCTRAKAKTPRSCRPRSARSA